MKPFKIISICSFISIIAALAVAGLLVYDDATNPRLLLLLFLNEIGAIASLIVLVGALKFKTLER